MCVCYAYRLRIMYATLPGLAGGYAALDESENVLSLRYTTAWKLQQTKNRKILEKVNPYRRFYSWCF